MSCKFWFAVYQWLRSKQRRLLQLLCLVIYINHFLLSAFVAWLACWAFGIWIIYTCIALYNQSRIDSQSESKANQMLCSMITLTLSVLLISSYGLFYCSTWGLEKRGSRPKKFLRTLFIWDHIRDYFPIKLHLCEEIYSKLEQENPLNTERDPHRVESVPVTPSIFTRDRNYLVGYHPHGIFAIGAVINFGTEATGFSQKFPGLKPWLTTLDLNFKVPIHRDFFMSLNIVSATFESVHYLLDPNKCGTTGNFIVVVLGGAPEALDARPGKYVFHTNRRFGLFKLALLTGTSLVPCVSFGEQNMYQQVANPPGSWLRKWQDCFTKFATFSMPLFYAYMNIPFRTPINTVVGNPIPVPKIEHPTRQQVASLKALYLNGLEELFQRYKPLYDPEAGDIEHF